MAPRTLIAGLLLLLGQVLAQGRAIDQGADPELDKYCQQQYPGKHAWCRYPGNGRCMKCATCEGKGEKYHHPEMDEDLCCWEEGEKWTWNEEAKTGDCCPPELAFLVDLKAKKGGCCPPAGHVYFYDEGSRRGSCCPQTSVGFDGNMCKDPPPPKDPVPDDQPPPTSGNGGHCDGKPPPGSKPDSGQDAGCGGQCQNDCGGRCQNNCGGQNQNNCGGQNQNNCRPGNCLGGGGATSNVGTIPPTCAERICPDPNGDMLGIEYGSCYRIKNPQGKALCKRHPGLDYVWGGFYEDTYQFRVCRSTSDCSKGGELSVDDKFVLNDQHGSSMKLFGGGQKIWVSTGITTLGHFGPNILPGDAATFTAHPWCADTCGICLKGVGKGLGLACPSIDPGIGFKPNPRHCQPIIVEKVRCINDDGTLEKPTQPKTGQARDEL